MSIKDTLKECVTALDEKRPNAARLLCWQMEPAVARLEAQVALVGEIREMHADYENSPERFWGALKDLLNERE